MAPTGIPLAKTGEIWGDYNKARVTYNHCNRAGSELKCTDSVSSTDGFNPMGAAPLRGQSAESSVSDIPPISQAVSLTTTPVSPIGPFILLRGKMDLNHSPLVPEKELPLST